MHWLRHSIVTAILLAGAAFSSAQYKVTVNGVPVSFSGTQPQSVGGRVLVPLRGVMEQLGAFVGYDGPTRTVTAQKGNIDISLKLGDRNARVNGQDRVLDVPAQTIGGTTMVPLRFMGEALGADIKYDAATMTIAISTTGDNGGNNGNNGNNGGNSGGPVAITNFRVDTTGWLKLGDRANFTLEGTPGGQASVIISGLAQPVRLTEGPSGTYTGSWMPGNSTFLKESSVIAELRVGGTDKMIQSAKTLSADTVAPMIKNASPTGTVNVGTPDISASYSDEGAGIDPKGVTLRVGGVDVTRNASVTTDFIFYRPDQALANGNIPVELIVRDLSGNEVSAKWNFALNSKANAKVTIFDHTARQGVEPMGKISFRLDTTPGSKVTLSSSNGVIHNLPMKESPAGVYRGVYQLSANDTFNNDKVFADIVLPDGTSFRTEAVKRILRVGSKTFGPATISTPTDGATVRSPLVVTGTALPGVKVNVRVSYATTMLNALRVTGNLADVTIDTDKNGNWKTDGIDLGSTLRGSNTEYTVTVTAIDPQGAKSTATTIKLKG
jgi:hypothetical protein